MSVTFLFIFDFAYNMLLSRDIINPVIIEEVKPIQLRITIQPGDTAVFK